ncbi:unnamed protein product [Caenorhabditis brenneri]
MANNEQWRRRMEQDEEEEARRMEEEMQHFQDLFDLHGRNEVIQDGEEGEEDNDEEVFQEVRFNFVPVRRGQLVPAPAPAEPVAPRRYPFGSGFPIVMRSQFDQHPHEEIASHNGLEWNIKWTTQEKYPGVLVGRATLSFIGLGDKAYEISATCSSKENSVNSDPDDTVVIDKDHWQIVFPNTIKGPAERRSYGQLVASPRFVTVTIHNIRLVENGVNHKQRWPKGCDWIVYDDVFSIRMDAEYLKVVSICYDRFIADLKASQLSVEEAKAFYDFACLLFHNAFYGQEKYQKVLMQGFKFGFVNYKYQDFPDSPLDFHSRTMLPYYQLLSVETPVEQVSRDGTVNGSCHHFQLKLNPNICHKRSQVEQMPKFRGGHKGQLTFYLEDTANGVLLLVAVNMHLGCPKLAKMKIALFENQHAVDHHETYRVVNSNHRTICIVVCLLTEQQIRMMVEGRMAMNVQLHLMPTDPQATHINNVKTLEDGSIAHAMPGLVNGWIRCGDGKMIGVCKEHVAQFSGWMAMVFLNQTFIDCGRNIADVAAPSEVVLDALQIIYHRCHAVHFDRVDMVLELAGFWASPSIRSYFDIAVWRTPLMLIEDKVRLACKYNLEITKHVLRHHEYHGIEVPAPLMAELMSDA